MAKEVMDSIFIGHSMFCMTQIGERQLDELVQQTLKTFDVPGISVGIYKDGNVVYAKGHGVRSLNSQKAMDAEYLSRGGL